MTVEVRPTTKDRVEALDYDRLRLRAALMQDVVNASSHRCDIGLGRFDEELAFVTAKVETEEVEAIVNVHDSRLVLSQCHSVIMG